MTKLLPVYGCDVPMATAFIHKMNLDKGAFLCNLSGKFREQKLLNKVTKFPSTTYAG